MVNLIRPAETIISRIDSWQVIITPRPVATTVLHYPKITCAPVPYQAAKFGWRFGRGCSSENTSRFILSLKGPEEDVVRLYYEKRRPGILSINVEVGHSIRGRRGGWLDEFMEPFVRLWVLYWPIRSAITMRDKIAKPHFGFFLRLLCCCWPQDVNSQVVLCLWHYRSLCCLKSGRPNVVILAHTTGDILRWDWAITESQMRRWTRKGWWCHV